MEAHMVNYTAVYSLQTSFASHLKVMMGNNKMHVMVYTNGAFLAAEENQEPSFRHVGCIGGFFF